MAGFFVIASRQTAIYRPPLHCAAVSLGRPVDIDMKALRFIALLLAVGAAAYVYLRPADQRALTELRDLPWQIELLPDGGSRVFGLELTRSTLDRARARFGDGMKLGVVAASGETGSLEAYYDSVAAGAILGRMILVVQADAETLARLRARSIDRMHMNAATFRYVLGPEDVQWALQRPITAITFIPAADLDKETVITRFGEPAERVRTDVRIEHFLYPARGLDLILDADGKEVLQYVAPREFARLREPLRQSEMPVRSEAE